MSHDVISHDVMSNDVMSHDVMSHDSSAGKVLLIEPEHIITQP